jgi:hypothetical protein
MACTCIRGSPPPLQFWAILIFPCFIPTCCATELYIYPVKTELPFIFQWTFRSCPLKPEVTPTRRELIHQLRSCDLSRVSRVQDCSFAFATFLPETCFTIWQRQRDVVGMQSSYPGACKRQMELPRNARGSLNSSSRKLFHYYKRPSVRVSVCTSVQPSGLCKQASAELSKQEHCRIEEG